MGWTDIDYSFVRQNLVLKHKTRGILPIEALSDGARSVISMVADLSYRMVRLNPDLGINAVLKTPGIVLIDEVDMHLHPSWQQTVLYDLRKAFSAGAVHCYNAQPAGAYNRSASVNPCAALEQRFD